MKRFIKLFFFVFALYVMLVGVTMCSQEEKENTTVTTPPQPLQIFFCADMSRSISHNGVEIISSELFAPLYQCLDREIQLSFNLITSHSSGTPITLYLKPFTSHAPELPDLTGKIVTERKSLKEAYLTERAEYVKDSAVFFSERNTAITLFCSRVDSLIDIYRTNLASGTDLVRAVQIADDSFNYQSSQKARQILILNTDGIENRTQPITMKNKVEVILVNANGEYKNVLDSIVTFKFTDPKQTILHTLKQQL
jgi:hypothetical protein